MCSGFEPGAFQNLYVDHDQVSDIIQDSNVRSVKFVGSTYGGKQVAEICGRAMKRSAFELGGSDPFIVFDDADLELASSKAVIGRLHTNGQACNNSKRFITTVSTGRR